MKLLACIIIYEPDLEDLKKNLTSLIQGVDSIVIWKNSPVDDLTILNLIGGKDKSLITLLGNGDNVGISGALNGVIEYAKDLNYSHLLTMDQDSFFEAGHLKKYRNKVATSGSDQIGVYGVNPKTHNGLLFAVSEEPLIVNEIITSGSVIPFEVLVRANGFKSDLFIDAVDYEFCFRIKELYDLNTMVFPDVILNHKIGYSRKTSFGFRVDEYSAFRTYYIIRNQIYVWKRYPQLFERKYKINLLRNHIILRFVKILLAENNKLKKIKAIVRGTKDGLFNLT